MNKSECSTHCGMGWKNINFYCLLMQESGSRVVPDKECAHLPKPPITEECSGPCTKGHWKYGRWGMVSTSQNYYFAQSIYFNFCCMFKFQLSF